MNGISSKFLKIYKYLKFLNKTSICMITSYYTVIEIFLFYKSISGNYTAFIYRFQSTIYVNLMILVCLLRIFDTLAYHLIFFKKMPLKRTIPYHIFFLNFRLIIWEEYI